MPTDLRDASGNLQGILISEAQAVEIACRSRFCGWRRGVVVIHRYSVRTGELLATKQYKNPIKKEG